MGETIPVAVPRKGRPLETVLERFARRLDVADLADEITSTLRHEKALTKGTLEREGTSVYHRLEDYSTVSDPTKPEYTLIRDDRTGKPRRIVFDSVTIPLTEVEGVSDGTEVLLVGREEPFRALRTHEFALGFDSADLVLEEVVELRPEPLDRIGDVNARIDPADTDVQVVTGLGDTVYHTLMGTPETVPSATSIDRDFLEAYQGELCIEPRYERLVQAVLGTKTLDGVDFSYPRDDREEEAAIAETGLGVYLTMTGSTARDHGLLLGERLFPSETVLLENESEITESVATVRTVLNGTDLETALAVGR
ncbi:hypothetical protein EA462_07235 [Natrarchaeobius halalkaliphilus]|uniref:Uncharacterized protein n=1 Tax=Natrarchaeobius halalkaliphilus TaxID=1679091 RepID=A0A3N6P3E9_9EURY|nr:hypothetical protein [Natrarchaeobius halalkaliphilus]RQG89805.1 hypothetical protein EA462_07235 [Natrarchaeobius halalkaliphilus]